MAVAAELTRLGAGEREVLVLLAMGLSDEEIEAQTTMTLSLVKRIVLDAQRWLRAELPEGEKRVSREFVAMYIVRHVMGPDEVDALLARAKEDQALLRRCNLLNDTAQKLIAAAIDPNNLCKTNRELGAFAGHQGKSERLVTEVLKPLADALKGNRVRLVVSFSLLAEQED